MKMIIGGAYQGQLAWAQAHFPEIADEDWIDGKIVKKQIYLHAKLFMVSMNIYEM